MDTADLGRALRKKKVPKNRYNLTGTGCTDGRFCLSHADGKWVVSYSEKGICSTEEVFDTEEEACRFLYASILLH